MQQKKKAFIQVPERERAAFLKRTTIDIIAGSAYFLLGVLSLIFKFRFEADGLYDGAFVPGMVSSLREMTCVGTLISSLVALAMVLVGVYSRKHTVQLRSEGWYYLRLSNCVTETIILMVVLIGLLPFFSDSPNLTRFDCAQMHLTLPIATILLFVFNTPTIGKLKTWKMANGLMIVFAYAIVLLTLVATGILPDERAPYSFLRIHQISVGYILLAVFVVFGIGFLWSLVFHLLNNRYSADKA